MPAEAGSGAPAFRLAVLDFDGTLADSFGWFCGVLNGVAERYGFRPVEPGEIEDLRGLPAGEIVRRLRVPRWKLPAIAAHMHALAARDIERIRLFPGVPRMLGDLAAGGMTLTILSSNTRANVVQVLGVENAARIDRFACGASLFGKARRLERLVARCGVAPAQVLCLGDELRDLDAARSVGCAFGAVAWGYTRAEALAAAGPDFLFPQPGAVAPMLELERSPA